jgi:RNA polymerase sigma factor (sigma-70 family)
MTGALPIGESMAEQDQQITETVRREQGRLRNFIRHRVADPGEAEDILQDVFAELVDAYRLTRPIEKVSAWLFRVARNRIVDSFRKKKPEPLAGHDIVTEEGDTLSLEDLLPSPYAGPDEAFARTVLIEELEEALEELPDEQRQVFIAHEFEGRSFKEMAAESGVSINTLLARKRYAVLYLRDRLQGIYDEFNK